MLFELALVEVVRGEGQRLDERYVLLDRAGSGGQGAVYTAYDRKLDRKIAIKVLHRESPGAQARLLREAQALARLRHPNVVVVFDVGTVDDGVFLAMELVEGKSLRGWLAERPRGWREIVATLVAAGRGLAAAHAEGLVHRDFKPGPIAESAVVRAGDKPRARAVLMQAIGNTLYEQGRFTESERILAAAIALVEAQPERDEGELGSLENSRGHALERAGRLPEAQAARARALQLEEHLYGPEHPHLAGSNMNVGVVLRRQLRLAEAEPYFQRALAIWERSAGPDSVAVATAATNLGDLALLQGRFDDARRYLQRALAIKEARLGPNHGLVASTLETLGDLDAALGRPADGEALARRALVIRERTGDPGRPDAAQAAAHLARLLLDQGKTDEAAGLADRALAVYEKAIAAKEVDEAEPDFVFALLVRAAVDEARGRREDAVREEERAVRVADAVNPSSVLAARALVALARDKATHGRAAEAAPLLERAIGIFEGQRSDPAELAAARKLLAGVRK